MGRKVLNATESKNEEPKKSRGRPKKSASTPSTSTASIGKRKVVKSTSGEPKIKYKKIEVQNFFESASVGVALALGQGEFGQLGLGEDIMSRKKPALVGRELAGKKLKKVVAGGMHTICLTDDHKVYTFGCNDEGALGRSLSDDSEEFEAGLVEGQMKGSKIIDISAGDSHCGALTDEGIVYIWGCFRDNHGRLGLVKEWEGSKVPIRLDQINDPVIAIASGCDHFVMVTDEGKVFTLGCGEQGQLGRLSKYSLSRGGRRSAEESCLYPKLVSVPKLKGKPGKPVICEVYCGSYCTYIVSTAGDVFGFGLNNYHQLGIPDDESRYMPTHIPALSEKKWKMISGGLHHSILLDERGDVFSIGRGDYGRLGLGKDVLNVDKPTKVKDLKDIVHAAAGPCVSFAVDKHGKAFGWGMGTNLQLTTGEEDDEWTPVQLTGKQLEQRYVITVEGGGQHTVLLACDKMVNGEQST